MRLIISLSTAWKTFQKNRRTLTSLRPWISTTLDIARMKNPNLQCGTTLTLGPETELAGLCSFKGIPFTSIISSPDQDEFWDASRKEVFNHLVNQSQTNIYISRTPYRPGLYDLQKKELLRWVTEDNNRIVLIIRDGARSAEQREIIQLVGEKNIKDYNFKKEKRPWKT